MEREEMVNGIFSYIKENTTESGLYLQCAEEATELAHACMKMVRFINQETPSVLSKEEIIGHISEEMADVVNCVDMLTKSSFIDPVVVSTISEQKMIRWANRIKNKNKGE